MDLPSSNLSIYSLPHIPAEGINVTIAANNINVDTLQLGHPQYLQQFPFYWGVDCSYITTFTTVYKLNYTWVITLMLASTVLAATGLVGICELGNKGARRIRSGHRTDLRKPLSSYFWLWECLECD